MTPDDDDRILDEATDWLLLLAEKPGDPATQVRFQQWLGSDRRHAAVWSDLNQSYDLIGETEPQTVPQWQVSKLPTHRRPWHRRRDVSRHEAGHVPPQQARPRVRNGLLAATAAVLMGIWLGPGALLAMRADQSTGTGELKTVALGDGSSAQLGPGSAISISYSGGERRIELLAGQALFEVRPDKQRPFRVRAGSVTTTVLGTGFDVGRFGKATHVGVRHGKVRVDDTALPPAPVFLLAGDQVDIDSDGGRQVRHTSPLFIASWALGEVNARDRTVAQVIDDIRPWYRGAIIIADDEIAEQRVNGVYNARNPVRAVHSITAALGGKVTQITPWLLIVQK